jgi:transposase
VTIKEAAKAYGKSEVTVRRWVTSGQLPSQKVMVGGVETYDITEEAYRSFGRERNLFVTFSETRTPEETPERTPEPLIEELRARLADKDAEIAFLREALHKEQEVRVREVEERSKENLRQDAILMKALPSLEASNQQPESPKRRRWWPFGGRDQ